MGGAGDDVALSKLLSFALRHDPKALGLDLDGNGWVAVDDLVGALNASGKKASRSDIERVVALSDKQRFAFSDDGLRIRASQGHSVDVDLELAPVQPPIILYHGTVARFLEGIRKTGLVSGSRQHVHLSETVAIARTVGSRRGVPVVLEIDAAASHNAGGTFYRSANGVWLTLFVDARFITFPQI